MAGFYRGRGGGRGKPGGSWGQDMGHNREGEDRSRSNSRELSAEPPYTTGRGGVRTRGGRGGGGGGVGRGVRTRGGIGGGGGGGFPSRGRGSIDRQSPPLGRGRGHPGNNSMQTSRMEKSSSRSPERFRDPRSRYYDNSRQEEPDDDVVMIEPDNWSHQFNTRHPGPGIPNPHAGGEPDARQNSMLNPRYMGGSDPRDGGSMEPGRGGPNDLRRERQVQLEQRQEREQAQGHLQNRPGFLDPRPLQDVQRPVFVERGQGPQLGPMDKGVVQFGSPQGQGPKPYGAPMDTTESQERPQTFPGAQLTNPQGYTNLPSTSVAPTPTPEAVTPNDVEIVVLGKGQQDYAEMVERNVRDMGLSVDVMFPNNNIKIQEFIVGLSRNGTQFAIVIGPENVTHTSVTTHVLRGTSKPEEHRNMPLPDCYILLGGKVAELKRKKFGPIADHHVDLIKRVEEGKFLTDYEYKDLIGLVHKRWIRQRELDQRVNFEEGTGISTQEELQDRVLRIMGVNTGNKIPQSLAVATPGPVAGNLNPTSTVQGSMQPPPAVNFSPRNTLPNNRNY